jgi:hypothetical protein
MGHYWVSFEHFERRAGVVNETVSPSTWVDADSTEGAEVAARHKLREEMPTSRRLEMTTCVPFAEEEYQKEMVRLREYRKSKWQDPSLN